MYQRLLELLNILGLCFRRGDYTMRKPDNGFEKLLTKIYIVCLLVSKALLVYKMHIGKNKENEIDSRESTSTFSKEMCKQGSFEIDYKIVLCKITKSIEMNFSMPNRLSPFAFIEYNLEAS